MSQRTRVHIAVLVCAFTFGVGCKVKQPLQRGSWVERTDKVVIPDWFPSRLAAFYSNYEPPAEYPEEWDTLSVYVYPIDEVKEVSTSTEDLSIPISHQDEWQNWLGFKGYIFGRSLFGEQLVYLPVTPTRPDGGIYLWGIDAAGPDDDPSQPGFVLCLAPDFEIWTGRLQESDWLEYGVYPGELEAVEPSARRNHAEYYDFLNPALGWAKQHLDE